MRVTGGNCILPAIRNWQLTPLAAPRQRPLHTNPRSAACAISTAQDYHLNVWSYSSSGISSASTPASCNNRSCLASAVRFAVCHVRETSTSYGLAPGADFDIFTCVNPQRVRLGARPIFTAASKQTELLRSHFCPQHAVGDLLERYITRIIGRTVVGLLVNAKG